MKIAAFVDLSLYAHSVIDHAIWLARERQASVELINIVSPNELAASNLAPVHPAGAMLLQQDDALDAKVADLARQGHERLDQGRRLLNEAGVFDVSTRLLEGHTSRTMVQAASPASIIIMGKRGEQADLARLPLGSNLERLARGSKVPVLAVSRSFRPIKRMLAGVDAETSAAPAVNSLASGVLPTCPLELLHVGDSTETALQTLQQAETKLRGAGYEVRSRIEPGVAQTVIPERVVLDEIDLLAVSALGSSRLRSMILGSLTSELLRACQVPVLLC
ncbi:universal stress protein [Devosia sp. A16]|uniref:universal stress protein n=1 Tax=Devosia sp. A16 TaxID=1736675 RepID=UPI0006D84C40|nr:universal stress protein [Devosia sp. A16]